MHKLFVPAQAVGASLVYFDFWNTATSGYSNLKINCLMPIVSGAVAVTGAVAVDLFLTRTSAVGTGGTAATAEGTSLTAATFSSFDCGSPIALAQISARLTPTGGATAGAVLAYRSLFSEETNAGTYTRVDLVNGSGPLIVPPGTGIRVVQGGVASVGNIGFDMSFSF
jgi:hypothetical protein